MGFRILKTDGNAVDLKTLILRQFVGLMLLESIALVVSNYLSQLVTLTFMVYVDDVWSVIGSILFVLSTMLVAGTPSHRAIHDYIAKTKLELYDKNKEIKKEEEASVKEQVNREKKHRQTKQQGKKMANRLPKKKVALIYKKINNY